jgi:hypothetical protein
MDDETKARFDDIENQLAGMARFGLRIPRGCSSLLRRRPGSASLGGADDSIDATGIVPARGCALVSWRGVAARWVRLH